MNRKAQKKKGYDYKRDHLAKAIVIIPIAGQQKPDAKKYHGIDIRPAAFPRFVRFVATNFPGATHINLYNSITGEFIRQEKL